MKHTFRVGDRVLNICPCNECKLLGIAKAYGMVESIEHTSSRAIYVRFSNGVLQSFQPETLNLEMAHHRCRNV